MKSSAVKEMTAGELKNAQRHLNAALQEVIREIRARRVVRRERRKAKRGEGEHETVESDMR